MAGEGWWQWWWCWWLWRRWSWLLLPTPTPTPTSSFLLAVAVSVVCLQLPLLLRLVLATTYTAVHDDYCWHDSPTMDCGVLWQTNPSFGGQHNMCTNEHAVCVALRTSYPPNSTCFASSGRVSIVSLEAVAAVNLVP